MIGRYDAAINGVWLSEISDRIIVMDVQEHAPKQRIVTAEKAVSDGLRYIRSQRQSLSVTVPFVIWEQDVQRRKELLMRVQSWAYGAGGVSRLEINDRRGQMLLVRAEDLPALATATRWQETIGILFTAYELPYWMDMDYSKTTVAADGSLYVPGMGYTLVDAEVANTGSSTITALTLECGDTVFSFSGISLGAGQKLIIAHDDLAVLSAKIDGVSVLDKRTAGSDDELTAICGAYNPVSAAGGTVSAVFKARGVYL